MDGGLAADRVMYYTDLQPPVQKTYNVDRTIPGSANHITAQQTDEFQTREIQVFCATLQEIETLTNTLQADPDWRYEVTTQVQPIANGIDRFTGTISCKRWLKFSVSTTTNSPALGSTVAASYTAVKE